MIAPTRLEFAALVLEDGRTFTGRSLGADVLGQGEVVFNTAMTGYQEILSDPSYAGQMLCMTYPLQGNYGTRPADQESERAWARGFIARWVSPRPSHHSAGASLDGYLKAQGIPAIRGIDTRALTRHLRRQGTLRAVLSHEAEPPTEERLGKLRRLAGSVTPLADQDLVAEVSRPLQVEWFEPLPPELRWWGYADGRGLTIAVVDYGVKSGILRSLRERGCRVVVLPHSAGWPEIEALGPDGLLLTNGPGDPAVLEGPVKLCQAALAARLPLFGICLGHQILGRAIGATTSRLPFGHHGANHPVRDTRTGEVHITSQNHEFQVDAASLPEGEFRISHVNLNDGSVEGLAHPTLPVMSVQYHPEGCPGPTDNHYLFDRFVQMSRARRPAAVAAGARERSEKPRKVLIIGSGPIVIGQAAEFDYAGTQACKALREEGVQTVLVNSNPATIMTDEGVADRVYIEPLTVESVERVIARELPDAVLPTLGGQTGLNLAMELHQAGVLARYGVRFLGADAEVIRRAEDREAFKQMLLELGEPVPPSSVCETFDQARAFADEIGLPLVIRPAYTLGGTGGGFVTSAAEFERVVKGGLAASPIHQVLVERSLWGWKELEYEVMRDSAGTCITICNMENLDPMGVHTGDSIVVAPAQTLSDRDHQMLRSASLRIIRALGLEGGCNVQYALDPTSSRYYVIEVNPRVSRSSALASKATGYPIARVAAKIAVGGRLDEILNQVTGRTYAAFEPALDYVVIKVPRWPFDKFPGADRRLGTQMASTGECMAIERTFAGAVRKALRSLEQRWPSDEELADPALIDLPNDRRLFALLHALRHGAEPAELARRSGMDVWFLERLAEVALEAPDGGPVSYKLVDTCAAEFEAATPYYYSCHEKENEAEGEAGRAALVLGSGPIRIGQGIEFDYSSVHAAWALREAGVRAIMANSNPETVSTDFDTSHRLYFEPLDLEATRAIAEAERIEGAMVQFGGQTAINLAEPLSSAGIPVLGSSVEAIDLAEDRRRFAAELEAIGVPQPIGDTTTDVERALDIAEGVGYPVLVRPSYVLGGRAMEIVRDPQELRRYMEWARQALPRGTVLVDKYLLGSEVEVDAISDGETVVIAGVMEHVERAGVHSGDSFAVYPAPGLETEARAQVVDYTVRIARRLNLRGLVNVQYVVHRGRVYVLEVNPRASRTVPMLSKVTGVPMVRLATRVMLGEKLSDLGYATGLVPPSPLVAVKAPVFSMSKLAAVDSYLGPEMKSTGEAMGVDRTLSAALRKAFLAAGIALKPGGRALLTIADQDKPEMFAIAAGLARIGMEILATPGTAAALRAAGFSARVVSKLGDPGQNVVEAIQAGVELVINTMTGVVEQERPGLPVLRDGFEIRRAAVERRIPCLTSLDTAGALVESSLHAAGELEVRTIDEWRKGAA
ncbi:MAG: carbamoyl-phosphate synthase large subunit [Candidatus Dormibacteraeota bacterium]|uniref:Carbamoyl phosphate synthase small chain n=2 Tax=Candidatus Dormiibacter inghamiae TaxID=3127013 RepID=A0A934NDD5_9BACT|nr:carbamoyl-phosphate synthase large subunit [Candidatus Dormibacteraeota bacterium]MBJ7606631.1 carbamoyl-phosphate synthase large subunit [Candidatus Dormibacteraeota bacterium]